MMKDLKPVIFTQMIFSLQKTPSFLQSSAVGTIKFQAEGTIRSILIFRNTSVLQMLIDIVTDEIQLLFPEEKRLEKPKNRGIALFCNF